MTNHDQDHDIPGFEEASTAKWLFVGRGPNREVWYTLTGPKDAREQKFIPQNRFTGYLRKIAITEKTFKNNTKEKLDLHFGVVKEGVETEVVIRSGLESVFSRAVILKLFEIEKDNLSKPIKLVPYRSDDDEKVVFCSVQQFGKSIKAEWNKEACLKDLIADINSYLIQPPPSNQEVEIQW